MTRLAVLLLTFSFPLLTLGADSTGSPPAATAPSADEEPTATAHEGVWIPSEAVIGGMQLPAAVLKTIRLAIKGDQYEVTVEGAEQSDKGTCVLDTKATPKRMTIKSTEGANRGKTFLAIYEMKDADSMRVCYDLSGKEFPQEFKAPKDTQLYLVSYRRQKDEPKKQAPPK